jgi:hypothetical protein
LEPPTLRKLYSLGGVAESAEASRGSKGLNAPVAVNPAIVPVFFKKSRRSVNAPAQGSNWRSPGNLLPMFVPINCFKVSKLKDRIKKRNRKPQP